MEGKKVIVELTDWHFANLQEQTKHHKHKDYVEYATKLLERAISDEWNNIWFEREMKREEEFSRAKQERSESECTF